MTVIVRSGNCQVEHVPVSTHTPVPPTTLPVPEVTGRRAHVTVPFQGSAPPSPFLATTVTTGVTSLPLMTVDGGVPGANARLQSVTVYDAADVVPVNVGGAVPVTEELQFPPVAPHAVLTVTVTGTV